MNKKDAEHLLNAIQKYYKRSSDWDAKRYCGLTFKWDYEGRKVHSSMPNYLAKALQHFQHPPPVKVQDQPYPHVKPNYGAREQSAKPEDTSPPLDKAGKKIYSGGLWRIPFPCTWHRWRTITPPQRTGIAAIQPNQVDNDPMQTIFGLRRVTG